MVAELSITAVHDGQMSFVARASDGHEVRMDASPQHGGAGLGPLPMEVALMALAGCAGMDVISLLRKMRQHVTSYRLEVRGARADEHPRVFTEVDVVHVVSGRDIDEFALKRAVSLTASKYCSVSAMLGWGAQVRHSWQIARSVEAAA
jgi:putative redox protein